MTYQRKPFMARLYCKECDRVRYEVYADTSDEVKLRLKEKNYLGFARNCPCGESKVLAEISRI